MVFMLNKPVGDTSFLMNKLDEETLFLLSRLVDDELLLILEDVAVLGSLSGCFFWAFEGPAVSVVFFDFDSGIQDAGLLLSSEDFAMGKLLFFDVDATTGGTFDEGTDDATVSGAFVDDDVTVDGTLGVVAVDRVLNGTE